MVLTVSFVDGGDEETFLLAERERTSTPTWKSARLTPHPAGRARRARESEQRQNHPPDGQSLIVTLMRAVPYGSRSLGTWSPPGRRRLESQSRRLGSAIGAARSPATSACRCLPARPRRASRSSVNAPSGSSS
jgi:hypothetical protein